LSSLEFNELKLGPETAVGTIVERPKLGTREVVLHIARVPVVGDVEDSQAHTPSVLLPAKRTPPSAAAILERILGCAGLSLECADLSALCSAWFAYEISTIAASLRIEKAQHEYSIPPRGKGCENSILDAKRLVGNLKVGKVDPVLASSLKATQQRMGDQGSTNCEPWETPLEGENELSGQLI